MWKYDPVLLTRRVRPEGMDLCNIVSGIALFTDQPEAFAASVERCLEGP